jgi:YgiT-type zinc finger domain-containing protein
MEYDGALKVHLMEDTMNDCYTQKRTCCPICGSDNIEGIYNQSFSSIDESIDILEGYDVSVCDDCGMIFANNVPSQSDFDTFYSANKKYEADSPIYDSETVYEWNETICEYVNTHYGKCTFIADFGCGSGIILRNLKLNGFTNLFGLDTSAANCEYLTNMGIESVNKSLFSVEQKDFSRSIDVGICVGVLEHIVDLKGFISILMNILSPHGELIVFVPQIILENGFFKPFQEFSVEHINYFTYESLCLLFEKYRMFPVTHSSPNGIMLVLSRKIRESKKLVRSYVKNSNDCLQKRLLRIEDLISSQKPVVVYGVGSLTRYLLANTRFANLNIMAFADGSKHYQDKTLVGKPILSPQQIGEGPTILISTYDANDTIEKMLREDFHLKNEMLVLC